MSLLRHTFKHHTGTLVLVATALLLTGLLAYDRGSISTDEADKRTENIIEAWRYDDVSEVQITVGDQKMTMKREHDADGQLDWVLYQGESKLDGDPLEMTEVASNLELAMFYRKVDDVDAEQLGFTKPRAVYAVRMGELTYTLTVGGEAPSPKGGAYVQVEGGNRGKVPYVVTQSIAEELIFDVDVLRNKRLATLVSSSARAYDITGPGGVYQLERGGWGGWTTGAFMLKTAGAADIRADRNQLSGLFTAIGRIEAKRFVPLLANDPPGSTVIKATPLDASDEALHLIVAPPKTPGGKKAGCKDDEAFAMRRAPNPVAACIRANLVEPLQIRPGTLRDRRVIGTASDAILDLKLTYGERVVELARKGDGWIMRKPTEGLAEPEPTKQLLTSLLKAQGERIEHPDLKKLGLDLPRATVRVIGLGERTADDAKERTEIVSIGDQVDGKMYVRREDDKAVIALSPDVGAVFLPQPTLLRSTRIFDEEKKYVRGITIDCGGRRQVLDRGYDNQLSFVEPKAPELKADPGLVLDLLDGMRGLTATRWEAEEAEERHHLDKPWCSVSLKLVEPDPADATGDTKKERTLDVRLGGETQGGYYAQTKPGGAVFVAPRAMANAANQWMLSRAQLVPPLVDVDRITVQAGERTVVVNKRGEDWKIEGGSDAVALKVRSVLEQLIAEVVLHRGGAREGSALDSPRLTVKMRLRDKPEEAIVLLVGKAEEWRNTPVFHVRRSDLNATFLVSRARLQPLFDVL